MAINHILGVRRNKKIKLLKDHRWVPGKIIITPECISLMWLCSLSPSGQAAENSCLNRKQPSSGYKSMQRMKKIIANNQHTDYKSMEDSGEVGAAEYRRWKERRGTSAQRSSGVNSNCELETIRSLVPPLPELRNTTAVCLLRLLLLSKEEKLSGGSESHHGNVRCFMFSYNPPL